MEYFKVNITSSIGLQDCYFKEIVTLAAVHISHGYSQFDFVAST